MYNASVKKLIKKIGLIRRCFSSPSPGATECLYISLIRPSLEYCSPAWSPWLRKDIAALERVQKRCLSISYPMPILESLQSKREKQDIVETFKFLNVLYSCDPSNYFTPTPEGSLTDSIQSQSKHDTSTEFFSHRVITPWNSISADLAEAPSVMALRRRLRAAP